MNMQAAIAEAEENYLHSERLPRVSLCWCGICTSLTQDVTGSSSFRPPDGWRLRSVVSGVNSCDSNQRACP